MLFLTTRSGAVSAGHKRKWGSETVIDRLLVYQAARLCILLFFEPEGHLCEWTHSFHQETPAKDRWKAILQYRSMVGSYRSVHGSSCKPVRTTGCSS